MLKDLVAQVRGELLAGVEGEGQDGEGDKPEDPTEAGGAGDDAWGGIFETREEGELGGRVRVLVDEEDGVDRCGNCGFEVVEGVCVSHNPHSFFPLPRTLAAWLTMSLDARPTAG